mmetsp:Transcript_19822/g.46320  ORF Transcript_19822/g.46320 Transcript_19822/m.46320 type:complete len:230 (+) Transcript_19822:43-732(+)
MMTRSSNGSRLRPPRPWGGGTGPCGALTRLRQSWGRSRTLARAAALPTSKRHDLHFATPPLLPTSSPHHQKSVSVRGRETGLWHGPRTRQCRHRGGSDLPPLPKRRRHDRTSRQPFQTDHAHGLGALRAPPLCELPSRHGRHWPTAQRLIQTLRHHPPTTALPPACPLVGHEAPPLPRQSSTLPGPLIAFPLPAPPLICSAAGEGGIHTQRLIFHRLCLLRPPEAPTVV